MATYCERNGHKIGDRYIVTGGSGCIFTRGSLIELNRDDCSESPAFKLLSGVCYFNNVEDASGAAIAGGFFSFRDLKKVYSVADGLCKTGVSKAYKSVHQLNTAFGRFKIKPTQAQRVRQLELIQEELSEGIEAAKREDLVEEIDAACDLFVTVAGYMQQLDRMGCNIQEALKRVCENNMSKLLEVNDAARIEATIQLYKGEGIDITLEDSALNGFVVAKHPETGKALKPAGYVSVDISDCIPV